MPQSERHRKEPSESRLRLQTAVRLRWFGVVGQLLTVCYVYLGAGLPFAIGICLALIALTAWLNVFLRMRYPGRTRLSTSFATALLAYDIVQLAALLYLTGGIENPFVFLIVAPVTVSAATLPPRNTIALGVLAAGHQRLLVAHHHPLPWYTRGGSTAAALQCRRAGLRAVGHGVPRPLRLAARQGGAPDDGGARRHRDGAGARAAAARARRACRRCRARARHAALDHRRGGQGAGARAAAGRPFAEDIALLQSQAERCREILRKLTRRPAEPDPLHARISVRELIEEAAAPIAASTPRSSSPPRPRTARRRRRPGARGRAPARRHLRARQPGRERRRFRPRRVEITATWSAREVVITIADDGPGIPRASSTRWASPTSPPGRRRAGQGRTASRRAWVWASSSPRPCWSARAPPFAGEPREPGHRRHRQGHWPRRSFEARRRPPGARRASAEAPGASLESGIG